MAAQIKKQLIFKARIFNVRLFSHADGIDLEYTLILFMYIERQI